MESFKLSKSCYVNKSKYFSIFEKNNLQQRYLETEKFYHIYNHANGRENLFGCVENSQYFLRQWEKHIEPVSKTYAYCLMPNHIHILISIKSEKEVSEHFGFSDDKPFGKFQTFQKI